MIKIHKLARFANVRDSESMRRIRQVGHAEQRRLANEDRAERIERGGHIVEHYTNF